MAIILDGTSGVTTPGVTNTGNETVAGNETITGTLTASSFNAASTFGFKNRIINGAMVIDQRNAGASVTPTADPTYTVDRWALSSSQASKFSFQQNAGSITPPAGFVNYLGATSLSAYSVGSGDYFAVYQPIEGFNLADLNWGTANASSVTLSFKVYSSLTGTFGGALRNPGGNQSYPFTYTISAANTWANISVTIPGPTTGTWTVNNGAGVLVRFGLGAGSTWSSTAGTWQTGNFFSATGATSVVGTNGATFYITGVQLEKGSTATSFDYRPYGTELALCQRYLPAFSLNDQFFGSGVAYNSTAGFIYIPFQVTARTSPTGITTVGSFILYTTTLLFPSSVTFSAAGPTGGLVFANVTGAAAGNGCVLKANTTASIFFTGCEL